MTEDSGNAEERPSALTFLVVVPTYNRPHQTVRAVSSLVTQTYAHVTVVVVDDGSTDDTVTRLLSIDDPRLIVLEQAHGGAARARNLGAQVGRADYITFLDSDDVVDPTWLEKLAAAASERSDLPAIITCGFRTVAGGQVVEHEMPMAVHCWPQVRGCFGHAGTFAVRTELFVAVGGYAEDLAAAQHTELTHRLLSRVAASEVVAVDEALVTYHAGNQDNIRGNDAAVASGAAFLLREHHDIYRKFRRERADLHAVAGVRFIRSGDLRDGRRHLARSAVTEPWSPRRVGMALASLVPPLARRRWPPTRP